MFPAAKIFNEMFGECVKSISFLRVSLRYCKVVNSEVHVCMIEARGLTKGPVLSLLFFALSIIVFRSLSSLPELFIAADKCVDGLKNESEGCPTFVVICRNRTAAYRHRYTTWRQKIKCEYP